MATIDRKEFIDDIIANNGWHSGTIESKEDYTAIDNPRVALIVEYTNFAGNTAWGVTFAGQGNKMKYMEAVPPFVNNPKIIWDADEHLFAPYVNWGELQTFLGKHVQCGASYTKSTDGSHTVMVRCGKHNEQVTASIPYENFCMQPDKCAGRNSCPRDYACSE